jgi:hypothetical protein
MLIKLPELAKVDFYSSEVSLTNGFLRISNGFTFDGKTTAPDTVEDFLAYLVHDCLYYILRQPDGKGLFSRAKADKIFRQIALAQSGEGSRVRTVKAWVDWVCVRLFGWLACLVMFGAVFLCSGCGYGFKGKRDSKGSLNVLGCSFSWETKLDGNYSTKETVKDKDNEK